MQDKLRLRSSPACRRRLAVVSEARQLVTRSDYLQLERDSQIRHEWVGGALHAMTGTSGVHNRVAGRLYARLLPAADRHGCRTYISDMRIMTERAGYYPDVMVTCGEQADPYYETAPCLLIEVVSPSTRDIDQREKRPRTSPSTRSATTSWCTRTSREWSTTGRPRADRGSSRWSGRSTRSS